MVFPMVMDNHSCSPHSLQRSRDSRSPGHMFLAITLPKKRGRFGPGHDTPANPQTTPPWSLSTRSLCAYKPDFWLRCRSARAILVYAKIHASGRTVPSPPGGQRLSADAPEQPRTPTARSGSRAPHDGFCRHARWRRKWTCSLSLVYVAPRHAPDAGEIFIRESASFMVGLYLDNSNGTKAQWETIAGNRISGTRSQGS